MREHPIIRAWWRLLCAVFGHRFECTDGPVVCCRCLETAA
jgi:hypothetical protein